MGNITLLIDRYAMNYAILAYRTGFNVFVNLSLFDERLYIESIFSVAHNRKKSKRKVQGVPQSQPQPFPDPKRKRKPTNLNKHKPNKRTKSTKISSLFPKRGNRNTKRTEKHKNKMTHGKTYNKSPRRINHKATKSKTNTGTTALERSVEQTTGGFKALLQLANFTLGPDATLNTEIHKISVRIKAPNSVHASKRKHKNQINHYNKQRRVLMANSIEVNKVINRGCCIIRGTFFYRSLINYSELAKLFGTSQISGVLHSHRKGR